MKKSTGYLLTAVALFTIASVSFEYLSLNGLGFVYIITYLLAGVFALLWSSNRKNNSPDQIVDSPKATTKATNTNTKRK